MHFLKGGEHCMCSMQNDFMKILPPQQQQQKLNFYVSWTEQNLNFFTRMVQYNFLNIKYCKNISDSKNSESVI